MEDGETQDTSATAECLAAEADARGLKNGRLLLRGWERLVRRMGRVQDGGEKGPAEAGQSGGGPMGCFGHRRREEGE